MRHIPASIAVGSRSHGRALRTADGTQLWLSGLAYGPGRPDRGRGRRRGRKAADQAASEEEEASSHTGECESCIDRRFLSVFPTLRAARLIEAMLEVLDAMTRAVCGFASRPPRIDVLLGKGAQV